MTSFVGSPLLVMTRSAEVGVSVYDAVGHETEPCTDTYLVRSRVPADSLIQDPTFWAPWPPWGAFHA